ncbi:MAG: VOC family protein [Treponema sp.]|jgi:lactoylglutathione lyase|nr:VOC family protein [Treponema sp.]
MLTGITHLALTVKDMKKSLDFYCRVLGFEKAFELLESDTGKPWINYLHLANNQFVELFYDGTRENPWNNSLRGFNHICFEVDDIHKTALQIKNSGYKLDREPSLGPDNNWQCWITDPDGVRIELMKINLDSPHGKIISGLPV